MKDATDSQELDIQECKSYRMLAARLNFIGRTILRKERREDWAYSSSAKAFASTRGLGRMRHLEVKDLWLQALVKDGRVTLRKIPGSHNVCSRSTLTKFAAQSCSAVLESASSQSSVPIGPRGGC